VHFQSSDCEASSTEMGVSRVEVTPVEPSLQIDEGAVIARLHPQELAFRLDYLEDTSQILIASVGHGKYCDLYRV
jgi:hypothetical protein